MQSIGSAARLTGVHIETIRYYERVGLIDPPPRTASGRRQYSDGHIRKLHLIKQCRELGFAMPPIRKILELLETPDAPCGNVTVLVQAQLATVNEHIRKLNELRSVLLKMRSGCRANRMADCGIVKDLLPVVPATR